MHDGAAGLIGGKSKQNTMRQSDRGPGMQHDGALDVSAAGLDHVVQFLPAENRRGVRIGVLVALVTSARRKRQARASRVRRVITVDCASEGSRAGLPSGGRP